MAISVELPSSYLKARIIVLISSYVLYLLYKFVRISRNSSGSVVFPMYYNSLVPCCNNRIIVHVYCRWNCVVKKNLAINLARVLHSEKKI